MTHPSITHPAPRFTWESILAEDRQARLEACRTSQRHLLRRLAQVVEASAAPTAECHLQTIMTADCHQQETLMVVWEKDELTRLKPLFEAETKAVVMVGLLCPTFFGKTPEAAGHTILDFLRLGLKQAAVKRVQQLDRECSGCEFLYRAAPVQEMAERMGSKLFSVMTNPA